MAAPVVRQHISNAQTAPGTSLAATWPAATLVGSRLLLFIGVNANQITTGIVATPAGYALVNPPGKVIRLATGNEAIDVWVYEKRNATSESGAKTVTLDQSAYFNIALAEVTGDDNTVAASVCQASATGAGQTALPSGTTPASTIATSLALAFFNTGQKDAQSNLLPATFSVIESMTSGPPSSGAKITSTVAAETLSATGTQSASIDVAGGFNHSYANCIVVIPGPSGGGGGGPSFPATWDDGKVWHGCSLHYFGTLDSVAHAQTLADRSKAIVGWARVGSTDNFNGFADDIRARWIANDGTNGPKLFLLPYMKSDVRASIDPTTFPEVFYAHTCSGARIASGSAGLQTMQPDGTGSFTDPRGFTVTTWRDWKANDCWQVVDTYNASPGVGAGVLNGAYLDSMYSASYTGTQCNPATSTAYSKPDWVTLLRTIADKTLALRATSVLFANGLVNGSSYFHSNTGTAISSDGLLDHTHGALAEGWIKDNYSLWGTWPSVAFWKQGVNLLLDAQVNKSKYVWVVTNIANDASGNPPPSWTDFTSAQIDQWRRFSLCSFMLGQRGRALYEFVSKAPTTKPWTETHPYYNVNLGASSIVSGVLDDMAVGNGLYSRPYASGRVIVNPTSASLPYTVAADYQEVVTGAVYLNGSVVTVPGNDGMILVAYSTGANTTIPVVSITSPANGATLSAVTPLTVRATASDPDGIAVVAATVDGSLTLPMSLLAGVYAADFGVLAPGAHTVAVTATDAHASPLSKTVVVNIIVTASSTGGGSTTSGDSLILGDDFLAVDERIKDRGL